MKETLVSKEVALLAKEKGFDWKYNWIYRDINNLKLTDEELDNLRYFDGDGDGFTSNSTLSLNCMGEDNWLAVACSQSMLQKWLRDIHNIHLMFKHEFYTTGFNRCGQVLQYKNPPYTKDEIKRTDKHIIAGTCWYNDNNEYPTYELLLEKLLLEGLKLIKDGKSSSKS